MNYYSSSSGLQQDAFTHTVQQATQDPKKTIVKQFKNGKQRSYLYHV